MAVKYIYRVFSIISIYSDRVADDWCKVSAVAVAYATSVTVISDTCAIGITLSQSAAAMTTSAASQQQQPGGSALSDISLEFVSIPLLERRHPLYEYVRCAPQTAAVFVVPNQITGCREEAEAVTRAGTVTTKRYTTTTLVYWAFSTTVRESRYQDAAILDFIGARLMEVMVTTGSYKY